MIRWFTAEPRGSASSGRECCCHSAVDLYNTAKTASGTIMISSLDSESVSESIETRNDSLVSDVRL